MQKMSGCAEISPWIFSSVVQCEYNRLNVHVSKRVIVKVQWANRERERERMQHSQFLMTQTLETCFWNITSHCWKPVCH